MHPLELGKTVLSVFAFAVVLLPLGHLTCRWTDLARFRQRTWPERLLWVLSLSVPLSLSTIVILERFFSFRTVSYLFSVLALLSIAMAVSGIRLRNIVIDPAVRWAGIAAFAIAAYIILATVPFQSGNRIYESVAAADWSVRVPLVDVAIHRGEPLVNPFDGITDQTPRVRYYYYWYLLCGIVGSLFHLPARAVLTASDVWAILTLTSTSFLLLKYLFRPRDPTLPLKYLCLLMFPIGCVIGLDILAVAAYLIRSPPIIFAEMDWWRAKSDFSLSIHTAALYAPHHVAGIAAMFFTFLLLLPPVDTGILPIGDVETKQQRWIRTVLAGLCAASIVGCSTYIALFLGFACLIALVDRLIHKDHQTAFIMLGAGVIAAVISIPFLREVMTVPAYGVLSSRHASPLRFYLRSTLLTKEAVNSLSMIVGHRLNKFVDLLLRISLLVGYTAIEMGFFAYVLALRVKQDWHDRGRLTGAQRAQWSLFFGIALPALFLNSDTLAGSNDLGRHAGFALRIVAVIWAAPAVAHFLRSPVYRQNLYRSTRGWLVFASIFLGLTSQLYQVLSQRFYLYASNKYWINESFPPFPFMHESGLYYHDLYYGYRALGESQTPQGRVLYNPTSQLQSALMIYQTRYAVAPEPHCMTAFGGDIQSCIDAYPAIQNLFGGKTSPDQYGQVSTLYTPETATPQKFTQVCRQHGVAVAVVSDTDVVWQDLNSFVWHMPVFYATPHVRFVVCPARETGTNLQRLGYTSSLAATLDEGKMAR